MLFIFKTSEHRQKIISYISRLPITELGYRFKVERIRKGRSINQNKYYWGIIIDMLGNELGYLPEEIHDALRIRFLSVHTEKLPTIKSTTRLSTAEFEEYLSKIRQWASEEYQIYIPLPNESILE